MTSTDSPTIAEVVEVSHGRVLQLLSVLRYAPPTPGVVSDTRKQLIAELAIGPSCLRAAVEETLDGGDIDSDVRIRLTEHERRGQELADVVRRESEGRDLEHPDRVRAHLSEEIDLARQIDRAAGDRDRQIARAYGRARDHLLYDL